MARKDIIKEILNPRQLTEPVTRVNDRAKRFINKLIGKEVFDLAPVRPDPLELHKDYLMIFDIENEKVRGVLYDLAEESGFFRLNTSMDPVQEGKRCLFLYILTKITKEPLTLNEK